MDRTEIKFKNSTHKFFLIIGMLAVISMFYKIAAGETSAAVWITIAIMLVTLPKIFKITRYKNYLILDRNGIHYLNKFTLPWNQITRIYPLAKAHLIAVETPNAREYLNHYSPIERMIMGKNDEKPYIVISSYVTYIDRDLLADILNENLLKFNNSGSKQK